MYLTPGLTPMYSDGALSAEDLTLPLRILGRGLSKVSHDASILFNYKFGTRHGFIIRLFARAMCLPVFTFVCLAAFVGTCV